MKTINPDKLGLSKDKLMAMENFFKEKYIKNGKLAGIQTLIARKGKVVHFESTGLRDVENNKKIEKTTKIENFLKSVYGEEIYGEKVSYSYSPLSFLTKSPLSI